MPNDASQKTCTHVRIIMAVLVVWSIGIRLVCYHEPLERDLTTYAVGGHEMLHGGWPYVAFWDHKPPGIFAAFAAAELVAGYGPAQVYLINVVCAVATLFAVFTATRRIMGDTAGLWAAGMWAVLAMNIRLQANQPNTEVLMNAAVAWVFALYVRRDDRPLTWRATVVAGLLAAFVSMVKQPVIVPIGLIGLADVVCAPDGRQRAARFLRLSVIGCIVLATWGAVWGLFAWGGHVDAFNGAVFVFNRYYAQTPLTNLMDILFWRRLSYLLLCMAASGAALTCISAGVLDQRARPHWLLLAYAVGAAVAVAAPGKGMMHYEQLFLPVLSLSFGMAAGLLGMLPATRRRWALHVAPGVVLALFALNLCTWLAAWPLATAWSEAKYGREFITSYAATATLDTMMKPDETWWVFGSYPEFYFLTGRRVPGRALSHLFLTVWPGADTLTQETIADLERSRPDMIVISNGADKMIDAYRQNHGTPHPMSTWIVNRYDLHEVAEIMPEFIVAARKDSDLARRLKDRR